MSIISTLGERAAACCHWVAFVGMLSGCGASVASGGAGGAGGAKAIDEGSGGATADACEAYTDVAPANDVLIRIVNHRSVAVYVDTDCRIPFEIEVGGIKHPGTLDSMQRTCFDDRSGALPCCDCASAGIAIEPGSTWETHWSGLFYDETEMPLSCYADQRENAGSRKCAQATPAAAGPMRLIPHVFATSASNGLWPNVSDPISIERDFVLGTDGMVEAVVE